MVFGLQGGGIRFENYIAALTTGTVHVENQVHPVIQGVPARLVIPDEEWYTFYRNPRAHAGMLAAVDEASYTSPPAITMGDHPVVWANEGMKAHNVYFLMGHHRSLFQPAAFTRMFENALLCPSSQNVNND